MKTSVFSLLVAFVLALGLGGYATHAEAKLGGKKSFGKSYSMPAQKATPNSTQSGTAAAGTAANQTTKKGGFLGGLGGGLLGGLLAGGLFAALLGSGAFDGLAFGDILLFAVVGFLIYKFVIAPKRRAQQQPAGHQAYREMPESTRDTVQPSPMAGMSGFGEPAIQLPPGFDEEAFVAQAKDHYVKLQKAWDDNDLARVQDYFSADLFEMLQAERSKLATDLPATSVVSLMVELVRGEFIGSTASISLRFTGWIKEGDQTDETNEVWHLEKDMTSQTAAWIIVGIQQDN